MFAMFDDIYRFNSKETIDSVCAFCDETGADFANTFYSPETWQRFQAWQKEKDLAISDKK